jgi:hypothetical protein
MQQFDLGVVQFDKNRRNAMVRQICRCRYRGAQHVAILGCRRRQIWHGDSDMVQPADHSDTT